MNELFLGIDPSFAGTGVVILDRQGKIVEQKEISTKKVHGNNYDIESRMLDIGYQVEGFISKYLDKIQVGYIEEISFGSAGEASAQLAALNYHIRISLLNLKIIFYTISPGQLKKYITGNGQAKKNLMLKEVFKRWQVDFNSDNLADAYSLARYALDNYNKGVFEIHKKIKEKKQKRFEIVK
jgi:crossover junction endodeoxyribonuclease RuvC